MAHEQPQVVVAGHLCLDIIPTFLGQTASLHEVLRPGHLTTVGPAVVSTGGAVSNTGLALHRLGVPVRLMGKIGRDLFGEAILGVIRSHDPALADGMIISPDEASSYTLVMNPPGVDRMFLHCPGANDSFGAADIPLDEVRAARIFHIGYPTILRRLFADDGRELVELMAAVKANSVVTSLDISQPDPASEAGRVNWQQLLQDTLPYVDIFVPNLTETLFMLDRPRYEAMQSAGSHAIPDANLLRTVTDRLLAYGAAIVGLKLGEFGIYLRTTGSAERLSALDGLLPADLTGWLNRELYVPAFQVKVAGTTGAGDCAIAGLMAALLRGLSIDGVLTSAAAVGACNVERADATSGVPHWDVVQARLRSGWRQYPVEMSLPGWRCDPGGLIWYGPADQTR